MGNINSSLSITNALHDLQVVLETQYKDLKRMEALRASDNSISKSINHRQESIRSLENILGCINEAKKDKEELKLIKENTIKFIETFNTIFKQ
jgi:hypothetical protein